LEPIDEGRFGEVKLVKYNHEIVAVKIFSKSENKSDNDIDFQKEVNAYGMDMSDLVFVFFLFYYINKKGATIETPEPSEYN
jgi:hypothetical protein